MEQQLSDNVTSNRKTHESLLSAERQLSQLDAENILLRQLRVDLDASNRECVQLKRQVASFESEIGSLRADNTQLRQNFNGNSNAFTQATFNGNGNGHVGDSDLYPSSSHRLSTQAPLNGKDRSREQYAHLDVSGDRDQRPIGYPPPAPQSRDSVSFSQDQQTSSSRGGRAPLSSFASTNYSHLRSSRDEGDFDRPRTSIPGDVPVQSSFEQDGRRSSAVQSLADIMGGRRSTVHGDPSQRSSLADILSPPIKSFPSSGSSEGDRYRSDGNGSTNDTYFLSPMSAPTNAAPAVPRRQNTLDIPSRRNSSGGGMSTFYDDNWHTSAACRAPFGTSQSAASSMVSFEESERKLTALMTEKALLNDESSRLLQRGGKLLKERTRLQYVDARLDELGKEIAVERKKLSGKPG